MPGKAKRCVLEIVRERRLSAYPDEFGLEQDVCDVTLWLAQKYRVPSAIVWVDRHFVHSGREIAGITVMMSQRHPDPLTPAAREAFLALGYEIEHTGADTYGLPSATDATHTTRPCRRVHGSTERYATGEGGKQARKPAEKGGKCRPYFFRVRAHRDGLLRGANLLLDRALDRPCTLTYHCREGRRADPRYVRQTASFSARKWTFFFDRLEEANFMRSNPDLDLNEARLLA